ncbi:MAG: tyrosine-type recombinase/integrase [Candidatus Sumerlaeota bacterium]|nr:tyrosine-type recombinase/integrase [Candidatus Sumerlaeota bacterium]
MIIGFVRLALDNQGRWRARYSFEGADIRRVLPASDEVEARALAVEINKGILGGREMLPSMRPPPCKPSGEMSVTEAIRIAIRQSGGGKVHVERQMKGGNAFIGWLETNHPSVQAWHEVKPSMIAQWARELQNAGKAFDTVRLYLAPVKLASRFWATEEPDIHRDVARQARVKLQRGEPKPIPALNAQQMRAFLDWLQADTPRLHNLAMLMAFAGLRMFEAAALRERDLNLQAGNVTITDTGTHKPKNRSSYRVLPLCHDALSFIREHVTRGTVRNADTGQPVFCNAHGGAWTVNALRLSWNKAMKRARRKLDLPNRFQPHHLRASFATLARRGGCDARLLQAYLGHSRNDILGGHYEAVTTDDLRGVVAAFERAFNAENGASGWQQTGNAEQARFVSEVVSMVL